MTVTTDYLKLYYDDTVKLAKTMVIKSTDAAMTINELLSLKYGAEIIDPNIPSSWKYYLNICGEYHETDVRMTVKSIDTLEDIEFNRSNLATHVNTKTAYQYGSRYYQTLVAKYPDQQQLILGILYPAKMEHALSAENGSILSYPTELVEVQEITLIQELEQWIKSFILRWHIAPFATSDSLYFAAQHAILYLNIVPKLLNLRVKRCKTNEAHSFHIRQYLASHGRLDIFMDYMTLKQSLFLYRNIDYIERHSGHQDVFKWLIEKLLTERFIPIAEYSMRHQQLFDESYHTSYVFRKKPLNLEYNAPEKDYISLPELLSKESTKAIGNEAYIETETQRLDRLFKNSLSSVVQTKDLESSMVDATESRPYRLTDVLLNQWVYMAAKGLYRTIIRFKDPTTGSTISMTASEAFLYMTYINAKALGIDIEVIPEFFVTRVQPEFKPSVSELNSVVDQFVLQQPNLASELLLDQPVAKIKLSSTAFFDLCHDISETMTRQWYRVSRTEHLYKRALVSGMINRLYIDEVVEFPETGTTYAAWFESKSISIPNYTLSESLEIMDSIFSAATGYSIDPLKQLRNIQEAMLSMLGQLSSYSIQLLREINDSAIRTLNWAAIRLGDSECSQTSETFLPNFIDILDSKAKNFMTETVDVYEPIEGHPVIEQIKHHETFYRSPTVTYRQQTDIEQLVPWSQIQIAVSYPGQDLTLDPTTAFIGYESYISLSESEKARISDIYLESIMPTHAVNEADIRDVLIHTELNGFRLIGITQPNVTTS